MNGLASSFLRVIDVVLVFSFSVFRLPFYINRLSLTHAYDALGEVSIVMMKSDAGNSYSSISKYRLEISSF